MKYFLILLLAIQMNHVFSQNDSISIIPSFRTNIDNDSVKRAIAITYKHYLYSKPDSSYNNPYWNEIEKSRYKYFDFSAPFIYKSMNINTEYVKKKLVIYLMSIDKIDDSTYTLSAQYQSKKGLVSNVSIWCIQRVTFIKENSSWKLQNNIVQYTKDWNTEKLGSINYHYKCNSDVAIKKMRDAASFYDSLKRTFHLNPIHQIIDYYYVKSTDELGQLLGFDYFGVGVTNGVTAADNGCIFSNNIFHAHELVHFAFNDKGAKRNIIVEEGCADFLGSRLYDDKDYNENLLKLKRDVLNDSTYSIRNLFYQSSDLNWNGYNYIYPFGAQIFRIVYDKKGLDGINYLMSQNTMEVPDFIQCLMDVLKIKKEKDLFALIRIEILK